MSYALDHSTVSAPSAGRLGNNPSCRDGRCVLHGSCLYCFMDGEGRITTRFEGGSRGERVRGRAGVVVEVRKSGLKGRGTDRLEKASSIACVFYRAANKARPLEGNMGSQCAEDSRDSAATKSFQEAQVVNQAARHGWTR